MAKTLYDILEVSPQASAEAIETSYERLKNAYLDGRLRSGELDADTHFNLIKDAYQTLSKPALRERYDTRLNPPAQSEPLLVYAEPERSALMEHGWKWALVIVLAIGLILYVQSRNRLEAERLRIISEAQKAEQLEAERALQAQETYAEQQRRREAEYRERQEQAEAARARAELSRQSERIDRDLAAAEQRARREEERQRSQEESRRRQTESQQEYQRRQEALEAQRKIERERALVRQLERENRTDATRAGGIPSR